MITKYKLTTLARDLKLSSGEVIECLSHRFGAKKSSAVLTPEEVNYVLEFYTQKNQVESFEGYFAYRPARKPKTEAPKRSEPKPKPEPKPEVKAEPKPEVKPEPKPEVKPEPKP